MPYAFLLGSRLNAVSVFIFFCLLSVLLRLFSFFPSVIDHDESTYLEIARQMLSGKMLYVDYIDIKPPGIFLILAGFQAVFGYSIFVMRLLVSIWVALTAFMIFYTARILIKDDRASFGAGMIYIFYISTWSYYGLSITPETFFNLFTISSLYILFRYQGTWKYLPAGFIAGLGFIVKYFVLMDFTAFLIFFLILHKKFAHRDSILSYIISIMLAVIGFIIPFALTHLYYYLQGNYDAFIEITYFTPARYPSQFNMLKMLKFLFDFHVMFLPIFFFFYFVMIDRQLKGPEMKEAKRLAMVWVPLSMVTVILSGKSYGHYTIQLMLPVSLLSGLFFHSERKLPKFFRILTMKKYGIQVLAFLILFITLVKLEYLVRIDIQREVAGYLKTRIKEGEVLYTGNYHHILYYLLEKDSPTPYIHRSLLTSESHLEAFGIDQEKEFNRIISKRPVYIIVDKDYPAGIMRDFISANYFLEKEFERGVKVYRVRK